MTPLDWSVIALLNGPVIVWALVRSRDTRSSADWFLASRSLPWWVVGLSLYATAIDSSDIVADAGGSYMYGVGLFVVNWVGTVGGWVLVAHALAPTMYRLGMYTNAEYLEARFGPVARALSVFVQVQYRTLVIGIIGRTLFLTLSIVCGWSDGATWAAVVAIAAIATLYTVTGGLRSVALTDAVQSFVMVPASVIVFVAAWTAAGGWDGLESTLRAEDPVAAHSLLHVGSDRVVTEDVRDAGEEEIARRLLLGGEHDAGRGVIERTTPAWLVCLGFAIAGLAYAVVNHTQSMRLLGARSEWDLKMSVVLAGLILVGVTFLNLMVGILGRALHPELGGAGQADHIYPLVVSELAVAGVRGLVVAGILAAAFSTYDSISSTLSALMTRDVYARFLVKRRDDRHYLAVGRLLTPLIVFGSFAYVPLLGEKGIYSVYLELVGAFVVPLLTIYLVGRFTRAHRRSGSIGLIAGVAYGALALAAPGIAERHGVRLLPEPLLDSFATAPVSMLVTAGTMLIVTCVLGRASTGDLIHEEPEGWLRESQRELRGALERNPPRQRSAVLPLALGIAVALLGIALSFVVFW